MLMHRKQIDGTFMLRRCGNKTAKAHAQRRRNEKLVASAKAKEQGKGKNASPQYEQLTTGLWDVGFEPSLRVEDRVLLKKMSCS